MSCQICRCRYTTYMGTTEYMTQRYSVQSSVLVWSRLFEKQEGIFQVSIEDLSIKMNQETLHTGFEPFLHDFCDRSLRHIKLTDDGDSQLRRGGNRWHDRSSDHVLLDAAHCRRRRRTFRVKRPTKRRPIARSWNNCSLDGNARNRFSSADLGPVFPWLERSSRGR